MMNASNFNLNTKQALMLYPSTFSACYCYGRVALLLLHSKSIVVKLPFLQINSITRTCVPLINLQQINSFYLKFLPMRSFFIRSASRSLCLNNKSISKPVRASLDILYNVITKYTKRHIDRQFENFILYYRTYMQVSKYSKQSSVCFCNDAFIAKINKLGKLFSLQAPYLSTFGLVWIIFLWEKLPITHFHNFVKLVTFFLLGKRRIWGPTKSTFINEFFT